MYVTQDTFVQGHLPTHYVRLRKEAPPPATATRCLVPQENCGRAFWHRIHQGADRTERAADAVFTSPGGLTRMHSIICDRCAEYDALPLFAASFSLMSPRL